MPGDSFEFLPPSRGDTSDPDAFSTSLGSEAPSMTFSMASSMASTASSLKSAISRWMPRGRKHKVRGSSSSSSSSTFSTSRGDAQQKNPVLFEQCGFKPVIDRSIFNLKAGVQGQLFSTKPRNPHADRGTSSKVVHHKSFRDFCTEIGKVRLA